MTGNSSSLHVKYGFEYPFEPDPLVIKAMKYGQSGKKVLDVGCGEGADTVYFARHGFKVSAIDNNPVYLGRLRAFTKDNGLTSVTVRNGDVVSHRFRRSYYDILNCLLVGCCMMRSEFEQMLGTLKQTVRKDGILIMSLRNYLDPEYSDYVQTEHMIEPNTFRKREDCCKIRYYIEQGRLRMLLSDFEILHYYEGHVPDKYKETDIHGDSQIICRRKR